MHRKSIQLGLFIVALAVSAAAQTNVTTTTGGTAGTVPVFTTGTNVENSPIAISGSNVGIGATNPSSPLTVYTTDTTAGNWTAYFANSSIGSSADSTGYFWTSPGGGDSYAVFGLQGLANWSVGADRADSGKFKIGFTDGLPRPGTGDILAITTNGNVGIGTTSPAQQLEVNGNVQVDGGIYFPGNPTPQTQPYTGTTCGGDYAESMDATGDRTKYAPGDVLVLDTDNPGKILKSIEPYSTAVAGIYSTKPGTVGRRQTGPKNSDEVPMAMVGVVPTKVTAENGAIHVGDLLVSSSKPGYAMKGTDRSRMLGAVIGKAMGKLNSGTGVIEVLVTLQ